MFLSRFYVFDVNFRLAKVEAGDDVFSDDLEDGEYDEEEYRTEDEDMWLYVFLAILNVFDTFFTTF